MLPLARLMGRFAVPSALAIGSIGIYVASAIYIALFMWYFGRYAIWKGILAGATIAVALFFMFERWFLVPLPKGALEAWLGY